MARGKGKRFQISLPIWHETLLLYWAAAKGTSKTMLAQNILQARIEHNEKQIEQMVEGIAQYKNMSVEELKEDILAEANYSMDDEDESDGF